MRLLQWYFKSYDFSGKALALFIFERWDVLAKSRKLVNNTIVANVAVIASTVQKNKPVVVVIIADFFRPKHTRAAEDYDEEKMMIIFSRFCCWFLSIINMLYDD